MATKNPDSQVNQQITDAVTQTNVGVVGEAPAQAMGILYQMTAHSSGLAMQNAVANQNNMAQMNSTIVAQAINLLKHPGFPNE